MTEGLFTLSELVIARDEYAVWALNTLHNSFAVSYSLPMRVASNEFDSVVELLGSIPELECLNDGKLDLTDPVAILDTIPTDVSEQRYKEIAHYLSRRMFLSCGAYANPIFTYFRREPTWRIAEIISTFCCIKNISLDGSRTVESFTFGGALGECFFFTCCDLEEIGGKLIVGPCWRWQKPASITDEVGNRLTKKGISIILDAFRRREEPHDSKRLDDSFFDRSRLFRLGHVRAAVLSTDVAKRTRRIREAYRLSLKLHLNDFKIGHKYNDTVELLKESQIGVNHWNGLAVLAITLASSKYKKSTVGSFYYRPPSLSQMHVKSIGYPMICAAHTDIGWCISFQAIADYDLILSDASGRIYFGENESSHTFFDGLGQYLSRQVDKNHTNRHHFLDERINLLRYEISDGASHLLKRQSDDTDGRNQNLAHQSALDGIAFDLPKLFASNIAYILGADICNIYSFDFNERRLAKVQGHIGPFVADAKKADHESDLDIEASYVWLSGSEEKSINSCLPYNVLNLISDDPNEHSSEFSIGKTYTGSELTAFVWPGAVSEKRIGQDAVVVPIRVFGRSWGVIELRGRYPRHLRQSTITWLDEIARMIGERLFQEWVNKHISMLVEFASGALKSSNNSEVKIFDAVASNLISLFLSEACFIWYRGRDDNEVIALEASRVMSLGMDVSRAMKLSEKLKPVNVEELRDSENTLIREFLLSSLPYAQYDLSNATEQWSGGAICQSLSSRNLNHCCLIRLENDYGDTEGVIWLAGNMPFEPSWESILPSISAQIQLVFDIANGRQLILSQHQISLAHEARSSLGSIEQALDALERSLGILTTFDTKGLRRTLAAIRLAIQKQGGFQELNSPFASDHFKILEDLSAVVKPNFSGKEFNSGEIQDHLKRGRFAAERGKDNLQKLMLGEESKLQFRADSKIDFRDVLELNIDMNPSYGEDSQRNTPMWLGQNSPINVIFPYPSAEFIVSNLLSNAKKYNIGSSPPEITHRENVGGSFVEHSFSFKNVGWRIEEKEAKKIRTWKKRGKSASDYWMGDGIGAGLSGIEYHIEMVNKMNAHTEVKLLGPRQAVLRPFEMYKINKRHRTYRLWKQQPNYQPGTEFFATIEFVLVVRNSVRR